MATRAPTYRPGLSGGWALGADNVQRAQEDLKGDIKDAAIKAAAAQIGLQIGLLFIPVVGWAAAAIVSLVQYIAGKRYERKTKEVIEQTSREIKARSAKVQAELKSFAESIFSQELPAARQLAASGVPLEGFIDDAVDSVKKGVKKVGGAIKKGAESVNKAAVRVVMVPARTATGAVLRGAESIAKRTGNENAADRFRSIRQKGDKVAADVQSRMEDPQKAADLITGREVYLVAKEKAAELKAAAFKKIEHAKAQALAQLQSTEYRTRVRVSTAKALRGDLTILQQAQLYDAQERGAVAQMSADVAQEQAAINIPTVDANEATAPQQKASGAALVVGGGLAAVAALFLAR